jgi:hypothetical protein
MLMLLSDSVALMAIPELYRYGREGLWFGVMPFFIYMMEGVYQVRVYLHSPAKTVCLLGNRVLPCSSPCSIRTIL